ncbi:MAG: hypothetical protein ACYS7Y_24885 [Planctomycetota bacterium]|jgi:hypothetical protein
MSLEFTTTDELLDELGKRFDHAMFVGMTDTTDKVVTTTRRWRGNHHTVVGLCADVQKLVLEDFHESTNWTDQDEWNPEE